MSQEGIVDILGTFPQIPTEFIADIGSAIPILNTLNIFGTTQSAGTSPVHTTGSGNTITTIVQISQAVAAGDATKIGLSNFDTTAFSVSAAGFVTLTGGGMATTDIAVDVFTPPGTNPVVPLAGNIIMTGAQVAAGVVGANVIRTDSLAAHTVTIEIQRSTAVGASASVNNGVSHFNSSDFTVDGNGFVSVRPLSLNYTNVNHAASPYTVLSNDYYISVDCSAGAVTLNFPNAPTFKQQWIVKDRTGNASINNITITTPGGTVTFDGVTSFIMTSDDQAINLIANSAPAYEVF